MLVLLCVTASNATAGDATTGNAAAAVVAVASDLFYLSLLLLLVGVAAGDQ